MLIVAWCLCVDVDCWLVCLSDVCCLFLTLFVVLSFSVCCLPFVVVCCLLVMFGVCRVSFAACCW